MAATGFHELEIAEVRPLTDDAASLVFDVPERLRTIFNFVPGQYLTLRAVVDGTDIRRSYSICSPVSDPRPAVGIKRVPGGLFSNHALSLQPGDTLLVMPPQGRFTASVGGQHTYLMIAAGSGITPCLSIIASVLDGEPDSRITLIYGNRTTASIMFREDIGRMKDRYPVRFQVFHILSREIQDVALMNGRINAALIERLANVGMIDTETTDAAYLCGPQGMTDDATAALQKLGMAGEKIHRELFLTGTPKAAKPADFQPAQDDGAQVTVMLDGVERQFGMDPENETVLAASQRAGLDVPFSCEGGMCCTCRCKIMDGEAQMDVNYSLQDWEIEAGYTLACQTRPLSSKLILDFDSV